MKRLAICIPTRNNPNTIRDNIISNIDGYSLSDVDLYVFDSSDNDDTALVVEKIREDIENREISSEKSAAGLPNVYYVRLDSVYDLADKMDAILNCKYLKESYDYIWPIKDRSIFDVNSIKNILASMDEKPDAIFLNPENIERHTENDISKFYLECGHYVTSLETMIYRYDSVLDSYSFDDYPDKRGEKYGSWWAPFMYAFHKLAKIDNPRIMCLGTPDVRFAEVKGRSMTWMNGIFEVWIEEWIKVNEELPSVYDAYKDTVIKKAANWPQILGSREHLIELYKAGILTTQKVEKYGVYWSRISDIPFEIVKRISEGNYDILHDLTYYANSGAEIIDLTIKMLECLERGEIQIDDFPVESVIGGIEQLVIPGVSGINGMKYQLKGTFNDLRIRMNGEKTIECYKECIQMLINMVFLLFAR